jgi:Tfp pilus assembly protein PilO
MNRLFDREMILQVLAALFLCVGGWMLFVEPKVRELHVLEAASATIDSAQLSSANEQVLRMVARLEETRRRVGEIQSQNAIAAESSLMYAFVMDCAAEHGVMVRCLAPEAGGQRDRSHQATRAITFNMTIEGELEPVASFLDAVTGIGRFIRPVSMHLTPIDRGAATMVHTRFTCEALSFPLPQDLAALAQGPTSDD